ncbi:hypothetical protein EVAR_63647_1 [Eumeta japonica]|uniref:Uncharacterized protein n=1 Tax=Eumeta variegata TaxID=151549 RepID=A0A4C1ZBV8_EUMVA|nr:hypothetical protein EVAR_63647_1 [Eumeta japonica]
MNPLNVRSTRAGCAHTLSPQSLVRRWRYRRYRRARIAFTNTYDRVSVAIGALHPHKRAPRPRRACRIRSARSNAV